VLKVQSIHDPSDKPQCDMGVKDAVLRIRRPVADMDGG